MSACHPFVVERYKLSQLTAEGYWIPHHKGPWDAIVIGSRSDFDRCIIVPGGELTTPKAAPSNLWWRAQLPPSAHGVSVERPLIGAVEGGIAICPPWAESTSNSIRARPPDGQAYMALYANTLDPVLDLVYYQCCPPVLPTKRAPFDWVTYMNDIGAAGLTSATYYLPGWGRRQVELSIELAGHVGDVTWSFSGLNAAKTASPFYWTHDLQSGTTETADFNRTYLFDGEFDLYKLAMSVPANEGSEASLRISVKAWD